MLRIGEGVEKGLNMVEIEKGFLIHSLNSRNGWNFENRQCTLPTSSITGTPGFFYFYSETTHPHPNEITKYKTDPVTTYYEVTCNDWNQRYIAPTTSR